MQEEVGVREVRVPSSLSPGQGKLFKWHLEPGLVSELCYPHLQSQHVTAAALSPAGFRLSPAVKAAS